MFIHSSNLSSNPQKHDSKCRFMTKLAQSNKLGRFDARMRTIEDKEVSLFTVLQGGTQV